MIEKKKSQSMCVLIARRLESWVLHTVLLKCIINIDCITSSRFIIILPLLVCAAIHSTGIII